jgi:hypothetical protein
VPAQDRDTSAESYLRVLSTLTEEARRRRARAVRIRLRTKKASLACAVLVLLAFMALSVLVLSGFINVRVLHVRLSGSPSFHPVPLRVGEPRASPGEPARLGKTLLADGPAPVRAVQEPRSVPSKAVTLLVVVAARGSSWIEARRGSATGRQLYAGTLAQGKVLRLQGPRLWVRFGALAYVDLRLDDKAVLLAHTGTVNALFTPAGIRPG